MVNQTVRPERCIDSAVSHRRRFSFLTYSQESGVGTGRDLQDACTPLWECEVGAFVSSCRSQHLVHHGSLSCNTNHQLF